MIIQGQDLMLFIGSGATKTSIGYATSHTLSINADTKETTTKDSSGGGDWQTSEVGTLSWSVSTENLYGDDVKGKTYEDLFDIMVSKKPIEMVFGGKTGTDIPATGWVNSAPTYTGKAIITSLELNTPNGDNTTFSASFTGVGALSRTAKQPAAKA